MAKVNNISVDGNHKPKCPECQRKWTVYRIRTDTLVCRHCGCVFKWNRERQIGTIIKTGGDIGK